jgi:hypothetical protein
MRSEALRRLMEKQLGKKAVGLGKLENETDSYERTRLSDVLERTEQSSP